MNLTGSPRLARFELSEGGDAPATRPDGSGTASSIFRRWRCCTATLTLTGARHWTFAARSLITRACCETAFAR